MNTSLYFSFNQTDGTMDYEGYTNLSSSYDYFEDFPPIPERDLLPPPLPGNIRILLLLVYITIICASLFGNIMVISIIIKYHKMRTVINIFLASLAVSINY